MSQTAKDSTASSLRARMSLRPAPPPGALPRRRRAAAPRARAQDGRRVRLGRGVLAGQRHGHWRQPAAGRVHHRRVLRAVPGRVPQGARLPNPTLRRCCVGDRPRAPDTCEHCAALPGQFDRATLAATHFGAELQLHPGSCHARVHWRRHAQVYKYEAVCDGCVGAAPQLGQRFSGGGKESPEYARGNYLLRTLGMQAGP